MQLTKQIFCPNCGESNNASSNFCENCGCNLSKSADFRETNSNREQSNFNDSPYDYTQQERDSFIRKNQIFYNEKFSKIEMTGKKESWNWSAFLLGVYWFLYRKMYVQGCIYLLASSVACAIPFIGWIFNIAMWIGVGVYSNSLYLDHINKKFMDIKHAPNGSREKLIYSKGGTNLIVPIVLFVIPIILFVFVFLFIFMMDFVAEILYWM